MKKKIIFMTVTMLIASNITVFASTVNNKENQIKENQETIQNLEKEKQELNAEKKQLSSELQSVIDQFTSVAREAEILNTAITQKESEIQARESLINATNSKISLLENEINTRQIEIIQKEVELEEKKTILDSRVRTAYMNNTVGSILYTLIESESLADFTDKLMLIHKVVEMDKEIIRQVNSIMEELTLKKAELEVSKKDLLSSKAVIQDERAKLIEQKEKLETENLAYTSKLAEIKKLETKKSSAINSLTKEEKEIASDIGDIIEENKELQDEISALIRAEANKNTISQGITNSQQNNTNAGYIKPVSGRVTSSYGYRIHPILGYRKLHTGIDFAATSGTPIKATRAGTVIRASYNSTYGNNVIIDHGNGVTTLYAHMSALNTSYGSKVSQGQIIGYVGSTGMSTGPHLHLEFRLNGNLVNPAPYLGL